MSVKKKYNEKEYLLNYLRDNSLSVTKDRFLILKIIFNIHTHFKVVEILDIIQKRKLNISRATLYRTIDIFLKAGLIHKYVDADNINFYEHTFGHKHHDHLICIKCNSVIEFNSDKLENIQSEICEKYDFTHTSHILKINGICSVCSKKSKK